MSVPSTILHTLIRHRLWDLESPLLLAVSGGCDSMVMMHVFSRLASGSRLFVAHIDHAVRPGSAEDGVFVESESRSLGLPFICRRLAAGIPPSGQSPEAYWRSERYRILLETMHQMGAVAVATAHTASDHFETVLLRLTAGSGPRGLLGIRIRRDDGVIRPMLELTREQVRAYAGTSGLRWREDESNADLQRPRNAIRARVIPVLREINPSADLAVLRGSMLLAGEDAVLSCEAHALLETAGWKQSLPALLDINPFKTAPFPMVLRAAAAIHQTISRICGSRSESAHLEALAKCLCGRQPRCPLPCGGSATSVRNGLLLMPGIPADALATEVQLPVSGSVRMGGFWLETTEPGSGHDFDRSLLKGVLLRTRRPGDIFLDSISGRKISLSEHMRLQEIPVPVRRILPVMTDIDGRIIWIAGPFTRSETAAEDLTGCRLILTCRPVWEIR